MTAPEWRIYVYQESYPMSWMCMNGRVVKGVNFVDLRDAGDPVERWCCIRTELARTSWSFLDITASSDARATKLDMVRRVAETVFIPFTVGGGIRTVDDFRQVILQRGRG